MSYQNFQHKVYSYLIKYKKENLNINDKGTSARGVEHDYLLPKPYCDAQLPVMLYDGIKETVKDIQASLHIRPILQLLYMWQVLKLHVSTYLCQSWKVSMQT
jgi:hypothetical protein